LDKQLENNWITIGQLVGNSWTNNWNTIGNQFDKQVENSWKTITE